MKRPIIGLACLSAVTAGVLALAGCGGSGAGERLSKAEYQQQGAAIGARLKKEFKDIDTADPANVKEVAPLMDRLGEALDTLANEFDKLNPPADVAEAQNRFVAAARATANEARAIGDRIQKEPLAELSKNGDQLDISQSKNFAELQRAMNEIKAKGYEFGDTLGGG